MNNKWTELSEGSNNTMVKRHPQTAVKAVPYWFGAVSLPATATFLFPGRLCTYRIYLKASHCTLLVCVFMDKLTKLCKLYIILAIQYMYFVNHLHSGVSNSFDTLKKKLGFEKKRGICPLLFKTFSQLSSRVYGSKCLNVTKHLLVPKPNQGVKVKVKSVWDSELSDKKSELSAKRNGQTSGKSQTHGS